MTWEKIATLTEEENKAFNQQQACKAACKKLIRELVQEWENEFMAHRLLWRVTLEKYDPGTDAATYEHRVDEDGSLLRRKRLPELNQIERRLDADTGLYRYFKNIFKKV